MLFVSERSWKHHYVTLLLPYTYLAYRVGVDWPFEAGPLGPGWCPAPLGLPDGDDIERGRRIFRARPGPQDRSSLWDVLLVGRGALHRDGLAGEGGREHPPGRDRPGSVTPPRLSSKVPTRRWPGWSAATGSPRFILIDRFDTPPTVSKDGSESGSPPRLGWSSSTLDGHGGPRHEPVPPDPSQTSEPDPRGRAARRPPDDDRGRRLDLRDHPGHDRQGGRHVSVSFNLDPALFTDKGNKPFLLGIDVAPNTNSTANPMIQSVTTPTGTRSA